MKIPNLNIDHDGKTAIECFKNSPAEYGDMLIALYSLSKRFIDLIETPESFEEYNPGVELSTAIGAALSLSAMVSMRIGSADISKTLKPSVYVEALIKIARTEDDLKRFATAHTGLLGGITKKNCGCVACSSAKKNEMPKMKVMKKGEDGEYHETSIDEMPDEIKEAIMNELKTKKEGK